MYSYRSRYQLDYSISGYIRNIDWLEVFLKGVMGFCGLMIVGLAVLLGFVIADAVQNPTYRYEDMNADGGKTVVEVVPTKDWVLHRLSGSFARSADFKKEELCDVKLSTVSVPITSYVQAGNVSIPITTWVDSEVQTPENCKTFSQADAQVLGKMTQYLNYGKQDYAINK